MKRKRKRIGRKGRRFTHRQVEGLLDKASDQVAAGDYQDAIHTCQRVLRYGPLQAEQRGTTLDWMGIAHLMLEQFDEAYNALSEAVTLLPDDADLWYNRGLASRFTMRYGQSVRDFERAVALEGEGPGADRFAKELSFAAEMAEGERLLRGPDFTLEQLIEQEEMFQQAAKIMAAQEWSRAEQAFRQVIEMGDCLPQPWGNLGVCLIMQERYDEAETTLRRALEINPDYEHARNNLTLLAKVRQSGLRPEMKVTHPLQGRGIKKSIVFREE